MCERFTLTADLSDISTLFRIQEVRFRYTPRYSIVPKQQIAVIVEDAAGRRLEEHRWGLMPFWAKDAVNAHHEDVPEKRAYRRLFKKQRCVLPCSGFFGWRQDGKIRKPIRIGLHHKELFAVAGLYEVWKNPRGEEFRTCTVLTTPTHRMLEAYNVKLPAILDEQGVDKWLNPAETDTDLLQSLLRPYQADLMFAYPESDPQEEPREDWGIALKDLPAKYALIKK